MFPTPNLRKLDFFSIKDRPERKIIYKKLFDLLDRAGFEPTTSIIEIAQVNGTGLLKFRFPPKFEPRKRKNEIKRKCEIVMSCLLFLSLFYLFSLINGQWEGLRLLVSALNTHTLSPFPSPSHSDSAQTVGWALRRHTLSSTHTPPPILKDSDWLRLSHLLVSSFIISFP